MVRSKRLKSQRRHASAKVEALYRTAAHGTQRFDRFNPRVGTVIAYSFLLLPNVRPHALTFL